MNELDTGPTIHLTPPVLAQRWSMSVGHLRNLRYAGAGPAYLKLGGRVVYRLTDIEDYEARALVRGAAA